MRIAVLIIGLLLGLLVFFQSVLVYGFGNAADSPNTGAYAIGVLVPLCWLVACAVVLPYPRFAGFVFVVSALFGFMSAAGGFSDMYIWACASLVLAVMSFIGFRGKRRDERELANERRIQQERDTRMETLLRQQAQPQITTPPKVLCDCGKANDAGSRFCASCGMSLVREVTV